MRSRLLTFDSVLFVFLLTGKLPILESNADNAGRSWNGQVVASGSNLVVGLSNCAPLESGRSDRRVLSGGCDVNSHHDWLPQPPIALAAGRG